MAAGALRPRSARLAPSPRIDYLPRVESLGRPPRSKETGTAAVVTAEDEDARLAAIKEEN